MRRCFSSESGGARREMMRRCFSSESSGARPEPQHAVKLTSLGTRRIFYSDHDMLREMARKFFETRVVPFHAQWEKEGQISRECWKEVVWLDVLWLVVFVGCFRTVPFLMFGCAVVLLTRFVFYLLFLFSPVRPVLRGCCAWRCPSRMADADKTFSARPLCGKSSPTPDAQAKQQTFDSFFVWWICWNCSVVLLLCFCFWFNLFLFVLLMNRLFAVRYSIVFWNLMEMIELCLLFFVGPGFSLHSEIVAPYILN